VRWWLTVECRRRHGDPKAIRIKVGQDVKDLVVACLLEVGQDVEDLVVAGSLFVRSGPGC
jgi:hypothetical protein